jgi:alanyl-tRNA synthetase
MALFGEKYGEVVRVVKAGDFSTELCGGTHVDNTSKIGLFRIISESSVAAGVRRIEAVTGANVLTLLNKYKDTIDETAATLKSNNSLEIATRAAALTSELREANKKIEALEAKLAGSKINDLLSNAEEKNGIKIICALLQNTAAPELRTMCDKVKGDNPAAVCVFGSVMGEKLTFCAACGAEAIKRGASAGNIVRKVAKLTGGNGGGKPDSAMAGGKDVSKANEAIEAAKQIIADMIGE